MPITAPLRLVAAAALVVLVASACAPNEPIATTEGTTPSVWTGSPAPSAEGEGGGGEAAAAESGETLTADLKNPGGTTVATAELVFTEDYATVTVETAAPGLLTPGFHGMHIHGMGKCEVNSTAPTGGAPGNFNSAGGHVMMPGDTGHPSAGDLPPLQVRKDGTAKLVTTIDTVTAADLLDADGSALMIHENADNFANIPLDAYRQIDGAPGLSETTMMTGDAGPRVACGVVSGP